MAIIESEFRSYPFIGERLQDMGWDMKSPMRGGDVYTQNEATSQNAKLKEALGARKPEYVVVVRENDFWVIEAKADSKELNAALKQAKDRAQEINDKKGIQCRLITGFAGSPDATYYIETHCLVGGKWTPLLINNRQSTGFVSPDQAKQVLEGRRGRLDDYDIQDKLFTDKMNQINKTLHDGALQKRVRAEALACLLLALANDAQMSLSSDPTTLINDINSRAKRELAKYGKQNFYKEIMIKQPTSTDNHIKNRTALASSISILRDLNIASTINSGRDILGQCYEQFLKYANDAKEIGIVLTPRHITNFGAKVIDIQNNDIVFDPTCGTGGFLVAALDKVRNDGKNTDKFKKVNLHGVEQDAMIATLAIVNMVFRGDGSSNIREGDCFKKDLGVEPTKCLMNPPFSLDNEKEWQFVDRALEQMRDGGLLFAVLPTNTMSSLNDKGEREWRKNLLLRHTLISVIKLPDDLFYPHVSKGTYGIIVRAHKPHDLKRSKVVWAVLYDDVVRTKTQSVATSNMDKIEKVVGNYIATKTEPDYAPEEIECSLIDIDKNVDLSPERHIGRQSRRGVFSAKDVLTNQHAARQIIKRASQKDISVTSSACRAFDVSEFFEKMEKGKSGKVKDMGVGSTPLITASEFNNGISVMVSRASCKTTYPAGRITLSDFGVAYYHDYEFAATSHVIIGTLRPKYNNKAFAIFLCAAINAEGWRYSFYRPLSIGRLEQMTVRIPVTKAGVDMKKIKAIVGK